MYYKEDKALLIIPFKHNDRYIAVKSWYIAYSLAYISTGRRKALYIMRYISSRVDVLSTNIVCMIIPLQLTIHKIYISDFGKMKGSAKAWVYSYLSISTSAVHKQQSTIYRSTVHCCVIIDISIVEKE